MESKTYKNLTFEEVKTIDIPRYGMLVIKSDSANLEVLQELKLELISKHGFMGTIMAVDSGDDVQFVGEEKTTEALRGILIRIEKLEKRNG